MYTVARSCSRTARHRSVPFPCRFVAGHRRPAQIHGFRTLPRLQADFEPYSSEYQLEDRIQSLRDSWSKLSDGGGVPEELEKAVLEANRRYLEADESFRESFRSVTHLVHEGELPNGIPEEQKILHLRFAIVEQLGQCFKNACIAIQSSGEEVDIVHKAFNAYRNSTESEEDAKDETLTKPLEPSHVEDNSPEDKSPQTKDAGPYGYRARRAARNARRGGVISIPTVPRWFLAQNVVLAEELQQQRPALVVQPEETGLVKDQLMIPSSEKNEQHRIDAVSNTVPADTGSTSAKYKLDSKIYQEILALATSGLRSANSSKATNLPISKPHLVLQSPKAGGIEFLTTVAEQVARDLEADVIKIDAQDIAEIAANFVTEIPENQGNPLRTLGYDAQILDSDLETTAAQEESAEEGFEEGEEESGFPRSFSDFTPIKPPRGTSSPVRSRVNMNPLFKTFKILIPQAFGSGTTSIGSQSFPQNSAGTQSTPIHSIGDALSRKQDSLEIATSTMLFDVFLDSTNLKRQSEYAPPSELLTASEDKSLAVSKPRDLIVLIQDYLELNTTQTGGLVLDRLLEAIRKRRDLGQQVIVIGVSTAEDLLPSLSKTGFKKIQVDGSNNPYRTVITPCKNDDVESIFKEDEKSRTKHINIRHLQDMLRRLASDQSQVANIAWRKTSELEFDSARIFSWGLDEAIWSINRIHRVASVAFGLLSPSTPKIDIPLLTHALDALHDSDSRKSTWLDGENARQPSSHKDSTLTQEERLSKLRKTTNSHERKVLSGVIDPASIETTFSSVHAPDTTLEALRTLTTLSLIRPDAFKYGVLSTNKIPGLLLYGPPGTGKTLLAKAVAKESGATVLEVSGSDIYDMYVGEGEKNVRAIFTLAQKLSPCVVFIDEADAIFGSRNTSGNRTSHRELINQFLREWDGMSASNSSAFIMVATNRPFDLDDAVLRRLPRRLLVDLPTEKDRVAILNIHLKDEQLASDVSLPDLAAKTPFYSGSDLKNMCVAAALACVKEETEAAGTTKASSTPTNSSPASPTTVIHPKRTLSTTHFDKALAEISASISEDMSSLSAIRKFDEKYGDRRGRRKKSGLGFGVVDEKERERERREEGRVRSPESGGLG